MTIPAMAVILAILDTIIIVSSIEALRKDDNEDATIGFPLALLIGFLFFKLIQSI